MKRIKKYITIALSSILTFAFVGCDLIERTEESIDKTVYAKVGKTKITKGEVDLALKQYLDYYKNQYGEDYESNTTVAENLKTLRREQLNGLIDNEVLYQSAEDLGVDLAEEELENEVNDRIDYYKETLGSDEQYEKWLSSIGYDNNSINDYLKRIVIVSKTVDKILEDVQVTDEEIETYYNDNIDTYTTKPGADVTHVLFQFEKDSDGNIIEGSEEKALAKANEARKKVLNGTSLEDIANSDEYKDVAKYEDLGRLTFEGVSESGAKMEEGFTQGFKELPANQVSEPVRTSYGYHLIVNKTVYPDSKVQELDSQLKAEIKSDLLYKKQENVYETKLGELKEKIKVKVYENRI